MLELGSMSVVDYKCSKCVSSSVPHWNSLYVLVKPQKSNWKKGGMHNFSSCKWQSMLGFFIELTIEFQIRDMYPPLCTTLYPYSLSFIKVNSPQSNTDWQYKACKIGHLPKSCAILKLKLCKILCNKCSWQVLIKLTKWFS